MSKKKKPAKKETRGRKPKKHEPIDASFDEVLEAIAKSSRPEQKPKKEK